MRSIIELVFDTIGTGYTNEPDPSSAATQMRLTVQVQLLADADQRAALQATLALTNQAANLGSEIAWQRRAFRTYDLQQLAYGQIRALGLSAQPAVRVIKKVADAYKLDRRTKRTFRRDAAQPFDDRCLSWQLDARRPCRSGPPRAACKGLGSAARRPARDAGRAPQGESDLVHRDGKWLPVCHLRAARGRPWVLRRGSSAWTSASSTLPPTSDGTRHCGQGPEPGPAPPPAAARQAPADRDQVGQAAAASSGPARRPGSPPTPTTASPRRIVTEAERTGRGIALEDLTGIRDRVRLRRPQRVTLHSWSFHQLGGFVAYKARPGRGGGGARRPGATPRRVAPAAGISTERNRPDQATFRCRRAASLNTPT